MKGAHSCTRPNKLIIGIFEVHGAWIHLYNVLGTFLIGKEDRR